MKQPVFLILTFYRCIFCQFLQILKATAPGIGLFKDISSSEDKIIVRFTVL